MVVRRLRLTAGGIYLVVLKHVVVSQDIAETIADHDPGAAVVVAATPAEALARIGAADRVAVAFVGAGPSSYAASDLARTVALRGGRSVLIGEEAEATGEACGWAVLHRPFSTEAILEHLRTEPSLKAS